MANVSGMSVCYGCGVCAMVCGKHLIRMEMSPDGFYVPRIENLNDCIDCGLCVSVCSYSKSTLAVANHPLLSLGAWSKDPLVRRKSSSGGVCYEFERFLLDKGYKICLVRYNTNLARAEHYVADSIEDLVQGLGSKYIQSYTLDAFLSFSKGEKYLVVGSPCQIDSLRRYLVKFKREDDFVLIDFFCHGVPSSILWKKYLDKIESQMGKPAYISWRNKYTGWHDSYAMLMAGPDYDFHGEFSLDENREGFFYSRYSQGDAFYTMFLGDACFNKACYSKCKYKYDQSSADVRVGDFWGNTYKMNEDGVSSVVAFTDKGIELVVSSNIEKKEYPFPVVAEGQMKNSLEYSSMHAKIFDSLKTKDSLDEVVAYQNRLNRVENWKNRLKNPHKVFSKLVGKMIYRLKK